MSNERKVYNIELNNFPGNNEFRRQRMNNLLDDSDALDYLQKNGIHPETIRHFSLGISHTVHLDTGEKQGRALLAPVFNSAEVKLKKYIYLNMPGITVSSQSEKRWMRGKQLTYYASRHNNQKSVIVCDSLIDLWLLWQDLHFDVIHNNFLLICSTSENSSPPEWNNPIFWAQFDNIYFLHEGSRLPNDHFSDQLAYFPRQPLKRITIPADRGDSWFEYFKTGGNTEEFKWLLASSQVSSQSHEAVLSNDDYLQNHSVYDPVDVVHAMHNGYLYFPVQMTELVSEQIRNDEGQTQVRPAFRNNVVLIRSDCSLQKIIEVPAPRGTPPAQRLKRLDDGTLIDSLPVAPPSPSWKKDSIEAYLTGSVEVRPLKDILSEINSLLKKHIWLPRETDYTLLTFLIPVTYCQQIFDAVPLVLVNGPSNTGKSRLGEIMSYLCANSQIVGQTTIASLSRQIDQSNGLFVLDDLESIGTSDNAQKQKFSEMIQFLKVCYKKSTAFRFIVDTSKPNQQRKLNIFGVKIINNTRGVDDILASRMIGIVTASPPAEFAEKIKRQVFDQDRFDQVRNDLHVWIINNVMQINRTYKNLYLGFSDRESEITAPLETFAELAADESFVSSLKFAISSRRKLTVHNSTSLEAVLYGARQLILEGALSYSASQIQQIIVSKIADGIFQIPEEDYLWKDLGWTGRQLNKLCADAESSDKRILSDGKLIRVRNFNPYFIKQTFDSAQ